MSHRMSPCIAAVALVATAVASAPSEAWAVDDPFAWEMPSAEDQLYQDETEIPVGMGALFIPSITDPANEPPAIVIDEDEALEIAVGQRVIMEPGSYVVVITSGSPGQGVGTAVDVREGRTTVVPVTWGALRIEVTDAHRVPHRGSYELIRADSREPFGVGFGADTLQGEMLQTWMLDPGIYQIVRPGANYRVLRDFATVYVPEAGFVRYRLVTDPDTGEFRGAGVLMPDEFGSPLTGRKRVFSSLVMGVDGSVVQRRNVVGTFNQVQLTGDVFLDGQIAWNRDVHHLSGLLQIEEGLSLIQPQTGDPLPLVKTRDRVRADALYTRFIREGIGPYARVAGETHAFETNVLAAEDLTILRTMSDGTELTEQVGANETFFVSQAFAPTVLREGLGMNARLLNNRFVALNWRLGFGLRQNLYRGAFVLDDLSDTREVEYNQVESFNQEGLESTIVATLRLPGRIVYYTDIELFTDFNTFARPSVEWRNNVSLRLTRYLSLNYSLDLDYLPQVIETVQLEQSLLLRASWALL